MTNRGSVDGGVLALDPRPGEHWWGGAAADGRHMPFADGYEIDLRDVKANQGMPVLLSDHGRWVHCTRPFAFRMQDGRPVIEVPGVRGALEVCEAHEAHGAGGSGEVRGVSAVPEVPEASDGSEEFENTGSPEADVILDTGVAAGGTLRDAYLEVMQRYYPAAGALPDPLLFTAPQYNLWIETVFEPTQDKVLGYAEDLLRNGFPPGVLMIDDRWSEDYGTWTFHPGRFPDPAGMVARLHELGFRVMLWLVPYVTPDSPTCRQLNDRGLLIRRPDGYFGVHAWWNGYSAGLDLLDPNATAWLRAQLTELQESIGIDGFKFDGGDAPFWRALGVADPEAYTHAWNRFGAQWPLNEFRDSWRAAGLPLAQRQQDKYHLWEGRFGLNSLIPNALAQSITGHPFTCPDMIGGGEFRFVPGPNGEGFDPELFVRYAQTAALFPMMQFSAAPWRVLDPEHLDMCRAAARLHTDLGPEILALARAAAHTGEPIQLPLDYVFPGRGYAAVTDQFLLGDTILVAPVTTKGTRSRKVTIPPGTWQADDGTTHHGPTEITVDTPLTRLPWLRRTPSTTPAAHRPPKT
ncbi:glycoside hydrolase family 31 protein [Embleya scabrispora]|uniref:glycoside hydrolase family 31 protein n=1 Tax=Embleya scabrispora TaxID=159449 RepID=UPI00036BA5F9|nr:glycoside hydrolase family 31 protein [Embleya scabrispora]MYS82765.1 glycoside hydrolase [Streptomyces sp. SID5474]